MSPENKNNSEIIHNESDILIILVLIVVCHMLMRYVSNESVILTILVVIVVCYLLMKYVNDIFGYMYA
mgnify:CR=1 FL=1